MWTRTLLVLVGALASCGGGATDDASQTQKDRGEATMQVGDRQWSAERCSAKLVDGKLTIRASRTDMDGGRVARQELVLELAGFRGAGDYLTGLSGSRFLGVGIDTSAVQQGEQPVTEAATAAIKGAEMLRLTAAKVVVTGADEAEVSGTFSWQPPTGSTQPAIRDGRFRAPLAK